MSADFTRYLVQEGMELYISDALPTRATSLYVFLIEPLTRDTATGLAMLPNLLTAGTARYPDRQQLEEKLSDLYGVQLKTLTMKRGDLQVTRFEVQIPNSRYLLEERDLFTETIQLLAEIFTRPHVADGGFREGVLQAAKQKQRSVIRADLDNRHRYAVNRFVEHLCAGERVTLSEKGYEEDLDQLTPQALYELYRNTIEQGQIKIFVRGDVDHNEVLRTVESSFRFERTASRELPTAQLRSNSGALREVIEESEGGHSVLVIGGRLEINRRYEEWVALEVAHFLLGAFPQSLLFKRLRDELGLAYYIVAHPNSIKGMAQVVLGIDAKNYRQVKEVVLEELARLQRGEVSREEVLQALHAFVHEHVNVKEDATEHVETYLNGILAGGVRSISQRIDLLNRLQPEDVVRAAARIRPELIYLLKGEDDDAH